MKALHYDPHQFDTNVSPFQKRNAAVATWGEQYAKKHYEKFGCIAQKSLNNSVDLIVRDKKGKKFAVEVKTHQGTSPTLNTTGHRFDCIHLEDNQICNYVNFFNKTKMPVLIFWIHSKTGAVYGQKLERLLENQTFHDVTFPQVDVYPDKKTFATECFKKIDQLTDEELEDLQEIMKIKFSTPEKKSDFPRYNENRGKISMGVENIPF